MQNAQAVLPENDDFSKKWLKARIHVFRAENIIAKSYGNVSSSQTNCDKAAIVVQKYLQALQSAVQDMEDPPLAEDNGSSCFGFWGKTSIPETTGAAKASKHMVSGAGMVTSSVVCVLCKTSVSLDRVSNHELSCPISSMQLE